MSGTTLTSNRIARWLNVSPWRILLTGALLALIVATVAMSWLMRPPFAEVATLVSTLAATSIFSLGLGYFFYRQGWSRSPSLSLTLVMTYLWAALLTLFNVWLMASAMFVSPHDLALAIVLLIFAAIIATTFGWFVAASIMDGLRQLARTARQVAAGDLAARAQVPGRDEVSQAAEAFNDMARQLQKAADDREEVETLRRDLIAWASHDLRTPLTSIRAMIEALHDGLVDDPETVRRYYRTIRADVVALNSLIDDLFELAQLDAGGLVLEKEAHSLADLISDTLERFRAPAGQRQIVLAGEVGANLDPVWLNAPKISRTLANLVGNALQYTPPGGHVRVTAGRTAGGVEVTVRDNGPGFAPADLSRVFEKFYRGEQARSRTTGGAGLGLAIARAIVEAHGGHIWAANGGDGGAVLSFFLPA